MQSVKVKRQKLMQYISYYESPLGLMTLAAEDDALVGLWFEGQMYFASTMDKDAEVADPPIFKEVKRWLDIYFSDHCPSRHH